MHCLIALHKENKLEGPELHKSPNLQVAGVEEISGLKYCLELCDFAIERKPALQEHKLTLQNQQSTDDEVSNAAHKLESEAWRELLLFQDTTPEQYEKNKKGRKNKTYNSIGMAILERKKATKNEFASKYSTVKQADVPILSGEDLARNFLGCALCRAHWSPIG